MGFGDKLKQLIGIRSPVVMDDPVFGKIVFQKVGFWEGSVHFSPLNRQVEILVDADEAGPCDEQREWLRVIIDNYTSVYASIVDAALREVREWDQSITLSRLSVASS